MPLRKIAAAAGSEAMKESGPDPIEVWGRRIGRTLAVLAALVLLAYLWLTGLH